MYKKISSNPKIKTKFRIKNKFYYQKNKSFKNK